MNSRELVNKWVDKWVDKLDLQEWTILLDAIHRSQVTFDSDVPNCDRFFVGISRDYTKKQATIHHDRDLTEEDIIHELIHLRFPGFSEKAVVSLTNSILKT